MSGLDVTGVSRLPMKGSPLMGWMTWYVGLSVWTALMVEEDLFEDGKTLRGEPEIPLGATGLVVVNEEVKPVLSWRLAMVVAC